MMRNIKIAGLCCLCMAMPAVASSLLPEGFVLNGISGVAVKSDASDQGWIFSPSTELTYMKTVLEAGAKLPILPSTGQDQIEAFSKDKTEISVRVWGILTQYQKKNYLFPIQILPLVQPAPAPAQIQPAAPADVNEPAAQANPDDVIPAELLEILRSRPRVDLAELSQAVPDSQNPADANTPQPREFSLIGKSGYITMGQTKEFVPDAFGRKIENAKYILLPCLTLEKAEEKLSRGIGRYRYCVSGIMTQYQGKNYLLLYRAERTYSNRNFTP